MKNSKPVALIKAVILSGGLVLGLATASAGESQNMDPGAFTQRMEAHWQQLIREQDAERRRQMIQEHRQMIRQGQTAMGPGPDGRMGMGGQHGRMMDNHHRRGMQHTLELHSMMLDLMQ